MVNGISANYGLFLQPFFMGCDAVGLAKHVKHKPLAKQVRDECYTKNHLSLVM